MQESHRSDERKARRLKGGSVAAKELNIGLIGYGFMGRAHSNAFRKVNQFFPLEYQPVLKVACARDRKKLEAFAGNWGWEEVETDWKRLDEREANDLIEIGSPNHNHLQNA